MTPVIARKVISYFKAPLGSTIPLTEKEQVVLCGLSEGLMYKEIAGKLSIPPEHLEKARRFNLREASRQLPKECGALCPRSSTAIRTLIKDLERFK